MVAACRVPPTTPEDRGLFPWSFLPGVGATVSPVPRILKPPHAPDRTGTLPGHGCGPQDLGHVPVSSPLFPKTLQIPSLHVLLLVTHSRCPLPLH